MAKLSMVRKEDLKAARRSALTTPTDIDRRGVRDIEGALNALLADVFALYVKAKSFHWHVSGPNFRDYHELLDEHATQIFAMSDPIAERVRKLGGQTIKSIGQIAQLKHVLDNDAEFVEPTYLRAELLEDNRALASRLRGAHDVCDENGDYGTTSLIEEWLDETERRIWFLFEVTRKLDSSGH
jgi:starvation-inducible DNA-binding protein